MQQEFDRLTALADESKHRKEDFEREVTDRLAALAGDRQHWKEDFERAVTGLALALQSAHLFHSVVESPNASALARANDLIHQASATLDGLSPEGLELAKHQVAQAMAQLPERID